MAARYRKAWLCLALLASCAGCASLRQFPRSRETSSLPAYTISAAGTRSTEFAELQHFAERDADKSNKTASADTTRSSGIQLTSADDGRSSDEKLRTEPLLPLLAEEEAPTPRKPSKPEAPGANPIFESAERLPPPKSGQPPRAFPTVEGQRLRLAPGESAVDRAVMLSQMLETAQSEARMLRDRVRSLELQIQEADRARDEERQVAAQAAAEATRYRLRMEALNEEATALRERLRRAERQDIETLREIISVLERLLQDEAPPKSASH